MLKIEPGVSHLLANSKGMLSWFFAGLALMIGLITVLTYLTRRSPTFGRVGVLVSMTVMLVSGIGLWFVGDNDEFQFKVNCVLFFVVGTVGLISTARGLLLKGKAEPAPPFEGIGISPEVTI